MSEFYQNSIGTININVLVWFIQAYCGIKLGETSQQKYLIRAHCAAFSMYVQQRQRDTTRARCLFAFLVVSLTKFNQQEIKFWPI